MPGVEYRVRSSGSVETAEVGLEVPSVVDVRRSGHGDEFGGRRVLADFGRDAECHRSRRHFHIVGDDGVRAHQCASPHDGAVQHHRSVADERTGFDGAPLQMNLVANHAVIADDGRMHRRGVEH